MRHSDRLRVCVVVPYDLSDSGGVKHHGIQLAKFLRAQGHEVALVGPSRHTSTDPDRLLLTGVVNVPSNGSDNRIAVYGVRATLKRFFAERTFDVIHIHEPPMPTLSYWTAWLTPGVPKIATFHAFSESPSLAIRALQRMVGRLLYPSLDHAIAVSPPSARYAARGWRRPLAIVSNGIPVDVFAAATGPAPERRTRHILAVGRLSDERKGIATLIDAFRLLRTRDAAATLDVVGNPPDRVGLPHVQGLRYLPSLSLGDLVERYRACDVFAAPSTGQESFGIVLLEAMAAGKPIVCSDIEGYRHVARSTGASFVPPRNACALAAALRELLDDEPRRRAMSDFNRTYVRRFDWSVIARDVVAEYRVAIQRHRVRRGASVPVLAPAIRDFTTRGGGATLPDRAAGR